MRFPTIAVVFAALTIACDANEGGTIAVAASDGGSTPTVAVAADGASALVAWVDTAAGANDVLLRRVHPDGELTPAVRVNDVAGDAAAHEQAPPQVATDGAGRVFVVWQNNRHIEGRRFPASNLRFARSLDGGAAFEPAMFVNDDAGGAPSSHTFHDIAVGPNGAIYIAWIDGRSDGGTDPAHEQHGGAQHIRFTRSLDGGISFEPSMSIAAPACPCCRTALAVAPDGTVYLAWRDISEQGIRDVVVAHSVDGGTTWSTPMRVHADDWRFDGCPHAGPALAVDAAGTLHAAWYTGAQGRAGLYYASSQDQGASFTAPEPLLAGGWVPPGVVKLGVLSSGVIAVWDDRRAEPARIESRRIAGDKFEQAPRAGRTPDLASTGERWFTAWAQGDSVLVRSGGSE